MELEIMTLTRINKLSNKTHKFIKYNYVSLHITLRFSFLLVLHFINNII